MKGKPQLSKFACKKSVNGGTTKLPPIAEKYPTGSLPQDDVDLDDVELDDEDVSDTIDIKMGSDDVPSQGTPGGRGLSEVANAISSCAALSFFSISMILANKGLAHSFEANLTFLPMAFQCFTAVVLVEGCRRMKYVEYEPFNWSTAIRWCPIVVFFTAMLVSSFTSMKYMSVPMITVFKSLTNIIIVTGDYFWHGQAVSLLIMLSLFVMTAGATLAAKNDLEFKAWGYFWMSANCFATAAYVLTMKFATRTMKLPKFGMVFYNNLLGFCLMLPLAILWGDVWTSDGQADDRDDVKLGFMDRPDLHNVKYLLLNAFAGCAGFLLNFAALWCVSATSATTYAVVNTVNNFPVSIIGYFVFANSEEISLVQWEFIAVNILGGCLYSMAKIREQRAKERLAAQQATESSDVEAVPLVSESNGHDSSNKRSPRTLQSRF